MPEPRAPGCCHSLSCPLLKLMGVTLEEETSVISPKWSQLCPCCGLVLSSTC